MHRFSRCKLPIDLNKIKKRFNNDYNCFCKQDKGEHDLLRKFLYENQGHYCAYCEVVIPSITDGHIEHLERRCDNPARSFDWDNMFFSCCNQDSCGNYKDNAKPRIFFAVQDIIDPYIEDPQDYFAFDTEGNIFPRVGLAVAQRKRAEETIRVFNLNKSSRLRNLRRKAAVSVDSFLQNNPTEEEINNFFSFLGSVDCISVYYTLLNRRGPLPCTAIPSM